MNTKCEKCIMTNDKGSYAILMNCKKAEDCPHREEMLEKAKKTEKVL